MNKLLSIISISFIMIACTNNRCNNTECADTSASVTEATVAAKPELPDGIVKAIECYINGGRQASSEVAKPGFAETATMSWYENGKHQSVPIQTLFDGYDSWQPTEVSYDITNFEVAEYVAMVAIDSKFGEAKYTDMFTLVKNGNDWKIVNKVYHTK